MFAHTSPAQLEAMEEAPSNPFPPHAHHHHHPLSDGHVSALASGSNTLGSEWSSSCWSSETWQSDALNEELRSLGFGAAVVSPAQPHPHHPMQYRGPKEEEEEEDEEDEGGVGEAGMDDEESLGVLFPPRLQAVEEAVAVVAAAAGAPEGSGKGAVKGDADEAGRVGKRHVRGRSMYEAKMKALAKVGRHSGSHVHPLTNALSGAEQAQPLPFAHPKEQPPQPQRPSQAQQAPQPQANGSVTCALDLAVVLKLLAASSNGDEVLRVLQQLQGKAEQDDEPNAVQREAQRRLEEFAQQQYNARQQQQQQQQHQQQQMAAAQYAQQMAAQSQAEAQQLFMAQQQQHQQAGLHPPPPAPDQQHNSNNSVGSGGMGVGGGEDGDGVMGRPLSRRGSGPAALSPPARVGRPPSSAAAPLNGVRLRRGAESPVDLRLQQRKERNREIARKSRARKKMYMQALEGRLKQMEDLHATTLRQIHSLASENAVLKQTTVALEKQVEVLSLENGSLKSASSGGVASGGAGGVGGGGGGGGEGWSGNSMEDVFNAGGDL